MRIFFVASTIFAISATAVCAADDAPPASPVVGKFPDTKNACHNYLFTLKKNGVSLAIDAQEFCSKLGYGNAVLSSAPTEEVENHKVVPGKLEWVVCQFAEKSPNCP